MLIKRATVWLGITGEYFRLGTRIISENQQERNSVQPLQWNREEMMELHQRTHHNTENAGCHEWSSASEVYSSLFQSWDWHCFLKERWSFTPVLLLETWADPICTLSLLCYPYYINFNSWCSVKSWGLIKMVLFWRKRLTQNNHYSVCPSCVHWMAVNVDVSSQKSTKRILFYSFYHNFGGLFFKRVSMTKAIKMPLHVYI